MSLPSTLDALTMKCGYCGLEQPVPNVEERRRILLEEKREARLREEREAEAAREHRREQREAEKEQREEREKKSERRRGWIKAPFALIPFLIAPVIIGITVFDAPARLGCGASGSDRLEQIQTQLAGQGCTVLVPIASEYTDANVSKLVTVADKQCIRAIAAGGSGHNRLSLTLYASAGPAVAKVKDTTDPQLVYCASSADTLRLEIAPGVASKGRLSYGVLACPAAAPKPKSR